MFIRLYATGLGGLLLIPLIFSAANAQTGKEAIGATHHAKPLEGPCQKNLANKLWSTDKLWGAAADAQNPTMATVIAKSTTCGAGGKDATYSSVIIQGGVWTYDSSNKTVQMLASEWEIYHPESAGLTEDQQKGYPLKPPIYGNPKVLFLGFSCFVDASGMDADPGTSVDIAYKITTTQVTPANLSNLQSALNAWLGLSAPAAGKGGGPPPPPPTPAKCQDGLLAAYEIKDKLPYDISITPTATLTGSAAGASDKTQDCSVPTKTSCTNTARTFHSIDEEFWDLSAGFALPGVREPQYSPSNPAVQIASSRHNDFYGMLDLYPFAPLGNKTSPIPHFSIGIPVTGKVFYRPFFGIAESITGAPYFQNHNIPQISLLYGVVYLNQEETIAKPAGNGLAIGHSRVFKGAFGLEISLSPLLSKIKAVGGGSSNSTGNSKQQQ